MNRMKEHEDFVRDRPNRNIWITIKANKVTGDYLSEYFGSLEEEHAAVILKVLTASSKTQIELTKEFFWAGVYAGLQYPGDFILTLKAEDGKPITVRK